MNRLLDELARRQSDVVRRSQLGDVGVGPGVVRAQIRAERWRTLGSTVVILHNGPLTRQQERWAAVLTAGPTAAAAGITALEMAGLRGWEDPAVHVLTPRGCTPPRIKGIQVVMHETRLPADGRLDVVGVLPRTRVDRSAIDAAGWERNARKSCGLLAAVARQRLSTGPRLLAALDLAGAIRHRKLLRQVLNDISGGAEALSEIDFVRFCRRNDLGRVVQQAVRLDATGRRRYLDVVIESPRGARVACEVDGAVHLIEFTYWEDMFRANELLIAGQPLLRFPTLAFRLDEAVAADQIRRALAAMEKAAA